MLKHVSTDPRLKAIVVSSDRSCTTIALDRTVERLTVTARVFRTECWISMRLVSGEQLHFSRAPTPAPRESEKSTTTRPVAKCHQEYWGHTKDDDSLYDSSAYVKPAAPARYGEPPRERTQYLIAYLLVEFSRDLSLSWSFSRHSLFPTITLVVFRDTLTK